MIRRLPLTAETLRILDAPALRGLAGAIAPSFSPVTWGADCSKPLTRTQDKDCGGQ